MAIRSGIGGQWGYAPEVTYGTYVAPTKFIPVDSAAIKDASVYVIPGGLAAGRMQPKGNRRVKVAFGATETVVTKVYSKNMGLLLQALMGTTVTPVIIGAGPGYTQTHTLADPFGKMLSTQIGLPDAGGTANDYTGVGSKILSAEFSCGIGEVLMANWEIDCRELTEAQTLASASYTASDVFHWAQSDFKIAATVGAVAHVEGVKKVTVKVNRAQKLDRDYAGNLGKKSEPIINENDENVISGTIDADYVTKTDLYDRFHAGTAFAAVWEFVGTSFTGGAETFRITLPQCYFNGETPGLDGPDVPTGSLPFVTTLDASDTQPFITYLSQESAL